MAARSFVHLHTHTEYSLLDGASRIGALFEQAREFQMPALAVTDHGSMFGALEVYVAPGSRFDRTPGESEEKYRHLTILARDDAGYRNLLRLVTDAHLEGFYHRPRIDKELLAERSAGLIGLSGCLASEVARLLVGGQDAKAAGVAASYRDLFGEGNFFLEVQNHGLAEQRTVLPKLVEMSRTTGIPLVPTNDLHYTVRQDAKPTTSCCASSSRRFRPTRTGCASTPISST